MASDLFVIAALKAKPACKSNHHHNTKKKNENIPRTEINNRPSLGAR
jgi:hypothetical protein